MNIEHNTINNTIFEKKHYYMMILREVETLKRQMEHEVLNNEISKKQLSEITQTYQFVFAGLLREGQQYQLIKDAIDKSKNIVRMTIDDCDYDCLTKHLKAVLRDEYSYVLGNETDFDEDEIARYGINNYQQIVDEQKNLHKNKEEPKAIKDAEKETSEKIETIKDYKIINTKTGPTIEVDNKENASVKKKISFKEILLSIPKALMKVLSGILHHPFQVAAVILAFILIPKIYNDQLKDLFVYLKATDFEYAIYNTQVNDSYYIVDLESAEFLETIDCTRIKVKIDDEEKIVKLVGLQNNDDPVFAKEFLGTLLQPGDKIYLLKDDYNKNNTTPTFENEAEELLRIVFTKLPKGRIATSQYCCESINYTLLEKEYCDLYLADMYKNGGFYELFETLYKHLGKEITEYELGIISEETEATDEGK